MIHATGARECPRRYVNRARGNTQEWYKQENQKHRVQVSRSPRCCTLPTGAWQNQRTFVVLTGNLQGFLLQSRACSPSSDGSERQDRTVIPISWCHLLVELSSWSGGKHHNVLGGRIRDMVCNLGRNSYNLLWQCECCIGRSCCEPWISLTVWKACPQKGVKRVEQKRMFHPSSHCPTDLHTSTYTPLRKAPRHSCWGTGVMKSIISTDLRGEWTVFYRRQSFPWKCLQITTLS